MYSKKMISELSAKSCHSSIDRPDNQHTAATLVFNFDSESKLSSDDDESYIGIYNLTKPPTWLQDFDVLFI